MGISENCEAFATWGENPVVNQKKVSHLTDQTFLD
jgi:hypothetical protein